jgi:hypothetical protein
VVAFGSGSFHAIAGPRGWSATGGAFAQDGSSLIAELPMPAGATLRQIDVRGVSATEDVQRWGLSVLSGSTGGFDLNVSLDVPGPIGLRSGVLLNTPTVIGIGQSLTVALFDSNMFNLASGFIVQYDLPVTGFFAVAPRRVYDSRTATAGKLTLGQTRTISVANGVDGTVGVVPVGAKAIAYNVTVTGTEGGFGFISVAPGGVTPGEEPSSMNWDRAGATIANGLQVGVNANREINVRCGGVTGSATHFIIDVVGYYL